VNYPYECTEQTLNRFLSTGILTSLYRDYPAGREDGSGVFKTRHPASRHGTPRSNRKMALEETPWLVQARGGKRAGHGLINVLDPRIAQATGSPHWRNCGRLKRRWGVPVWPGGPPSPYMNLYIMYGLAKASEFGVDVPRDMVTHGWSYLAKHSAKNMRAGC